MRRPRPGLLLAFIVLTPGCITAVAEDVLTEPGRQHEPVARSRVVRLLGLCAHVGSDGVPCVERARVRLEDPESGTRCDLTVGSSTPMALEATCSVMSGEPLGSWASPFIVIDGARPGSLDVGSAIGQRVLPDGALGDPSRLSLDEATSRNLAFFDAANETFTLSCPGGPNRALTGKKCVSLDEDRSAVYSLRGPSRESGAGEPRIVGMGGAMLFVLAFPLTVALDVATSPLQITIVVLFLTGVIPFPGDPN
jgi:hypothetical protein